MMNSSRSSHSARALFGSAFLALASGPLVEAGTIYDISNTASPEGEGGMGEPDFAEVAMVADAAGGYHVVGVESISSSFHQMQYRYFDGSDWVAGPAVTALTDVSNQMDAVDLAVDSKGTLHCVLQWGSYLNYRTYRPGEDLGDSQSWKLVETISTDLPEDGADRKLARPSLEVSENSNGEVVVQVAFVKKGSGSGPTLALATKVGELSFVTSDVIDPATSQPLVGTFPVIDRDPLPQVGTALGSLGPVIGFYRDGDYLVTQRRSTFFPNPNTSWDTPLMLAEGPNANQNRDFFEFDMEIAGGIAHFFCAGEASDGTEGALYLRRQVTFGLGGQQVSTFSENVAADLSLPGSGNQPTGFDSFDLLLDEQNQPRVSYVALDGGRNEWFFYQGERLGTDSWSATPVFGPPANFAGEPAESALAVDSLGRTAVYATRENGLDDRVVIDRSFPFQRANLSLSGVGDEEELAADLAVSSCGSVGMVYPSAAQVTFAYLGADGSEQFTNLELGIANGATYSLADALVAGVGQDGFHVLTHTLTQPQSLGGSVRRRVRIHRFEAGEFLGMEEVLNATVPQFSGGVTTFAVAGDEYGFYVFRSVSGLLGQAELGYWAFDTSGQRRSDLEEAFEAESPETGYTDIVAAASAGRVALLGKQGSTLGARYTDLSGWEDETVQDFGSSDAVPDQYAVAWRGASLDAAYADGNRVYATTNVNSTPSAWQRTALAGSRFSVSNLALATTPEGDSRLLIHEEGGLNPGISWLAYEGYAGRAQPELREGGTLLANAGESLLTFDTYGFPVVVARDEAAQSPVRQWVRSTLTTDADGDKLPFFMEKALGLDAEVADAGVLSIEVGYVDGTFSQVFTFPRAVGFAGMDDGILYSGAFRYDLEVSQDLQSWSSGEDASTQILFTTFPGDGPVPSGSVIDDGEGRCLQVMERAENILAAPGKHFTRLKVSLR
ncbi:hypothetical protein [Roseibacillus ishigakijimensis]|uniref:ELWxxDGT repeat-containing protein n=1 Tax=Roseibacillus ishigakijimensis TaxID=454146 RepID=A0A934VLZ6_9BACT|nr:hypothetical protein [Roseibacillus ishigakijimensis]MBK1833596.1 hypothetical protein [Roseibacillus ishigakijimensis]